MISFNVPPYVGKEDEYIKQVITNRKICGDGSFTKLDNQWLEKETGSSKVLLTTSCTHSLEMAAILADIQSGDEIILPSYTFCSTADAFVMRGAKLVFIDIRPDTMNMDEKLIEDAITDRTRVIAPVHYAGVGCEMDAIMKIAKKHNLIVIEDDAQGLMATYKGQALGTFGDFGCISFHETKNFSMGEGGALLIRDIEKIEGAEILREKGTNRSKFFRGQIDKGSSYLPSELNAAYLYAQLEQAEMITENRLNNWHKYYDAFKYLEDKGYIQLPYIPKECKHNAHMFYLKCKDLDERTKFIQYLKQNDILSVFHYIPLHSSPAGLKFGRFHGEDKYTTIESERLVRLPMYYGLSESDIDKVIKVVKDFYEN